MCWGLSKVVLWVIGTASVVRFIVAPLLGLPCLLHCWLAWLLDSPLRPFCSSTAWVFDCLPTQIPLFGLLPHHLQPPGCPGICMSNHDTDTDLVELSLQVSGLSITVRGAPDRAADFVRRVSEFPASSSASASVQPSVDLESVPAHIASLGPESLPSDLPQVSIQDSFVPCSSSALASANSHLKSTRVSATLRAERAWLAGQWALAVIQGRARQVPATPEIGLPQKYWVVLQSPRCLGCSSPLVCLQERQVLCLSQAPLATNLRLKQRHSYTLSQQVSRTRSSTTTSRRSNGRSTRVRAFARIRVAGSPCSRGDGRCERFIYCPGISCAAKTARSFASCSSGCPLSRSAQCWSNGIFHRSGRHVHTHFRSCWFSNVF